MADAKTFEINGTEYTIKDEKARQDITKLSSQYKKIANLNFPILLQNLTFFYTIYGIVGGEIDELAK